MVLPTGPDLVLAAAPHAPVRLADLLAQAVAMGASDVHIKASAVPAVRVDGDLRPTGFPVLTERQAAFLVEQALVAAADRETLLRDGQVDFAYVDDTGERFRGNAYRTRGATAMVLRHVRAHVPALGDLGFPPVMSSLALLESGLIIVSGPTGSGKSTTLASMVDCINRSRRCHILTIEDPIEFVHHDDQASVSQREVLTDTVDFASALRAGMRQDPDVILVGEIRDAETMRTALQAAETGHLVLTSLHAKTVVDAVNRVVDLFPRDEQQQMRRSMAETLRALVCQRLLPTGGRRALALELCVGTTRVQDAIADAERTADLEEILSESGFYGMRTFQQDLVDLVMSGRVTLAEAEKVATRPTDLRVALRRAGSKEVA